MGISIAIFSGLGIPLAIATKNPGLIGIGPAIGVALGIAIGASIEQKYKQQGLIRPLTAEEKKRKSQAVIFGTGLLIPGVIALLGIFLFDSIQKKS